MRFEFSPTIYKYYKYFGGLLISYICFSYAIFRRLPGIKFDLYARLLAVKGFLKWPLGHNLFILLLNPISGIRYFELDFAGRLLKKINNGKLLDISSPRFLSLWAADNCKFNITVINPDNNDLEKSKQISSLIRGRARIKFERGIYATNLPYADNSFDVLTSISVIEHINGNGDTVAMSEFVRVVRPGGKIILTFPVRGSYLEEYRSFDPYGTQANGENGSYFFQRFYDEDAIYLRIIGNHKVRIIKKEYFIETFLGYFDEYIRRWMREGLSFTVKDPMLMTKIFKGPTIKHPQDRMGNCHLMLEVIK